MVKLAPFLQQVDALSGLKPVIQDTFIAPFWPETPTNGRLLVSSGIFFCGGGLITFSWTAGGLDEFQVRTFGQLSKGVGTVGTEPGADQRVSPSVSTVTNQHDHTAVELSLLASLLVLFGEGMGGFEPMRHTCSYSF